MNTKPKAISPPENGGNRRPPNPHERPAKKKKKSRVVITESLRATDAEKHATSRSLYGDHAARISSNIFNIHDRIRQRAYEAVFRSIKGKTVLHLGCGMGLYGMLAARRGARHVVAVDSSAVIDAARVVAAQNHLSNLTFLRGRLSEVLAKLPFPKFDLILCEWVGAFLVNEPILMDVLYAREHLLAPGGVICPNRSSLHVVGVSDYPFTLEVMDFWSNVYGFRMAPMRRLVEQEADVCRVPAANLATSVGLAHTVTIEELPSLTDEETAAYATRLDESEPKETEKSDSQAPGVAGKAEENPVAQTWTPPAVMRAGFAADFQLKAARNTTLHYLTFYVDAVFTSPVDIGANFVIGIRPGGVNAWTEVSVCLRQPLPVMAGETIVGRLTTSTTAMKTTVIKVWAKTEGKVAAVETEGEYYYRGV
ncbi:unnamed protein product [Phytomonas sp. EM1]|nr:unnamed protein product [Phytomonas sp. EM1]|eukprot:CCW63989.1 unnamed protein product [Phytomonas sp. isolate EM1]